MKITFSLMTQKVFHADTSYLGQIMSTILASLRKYNCDLRPSSRQPDRRSHRFDLKLALNNLITFLVHQWLR